MEEKGIYSSGSLFFILCLCKNMDMAWSVAMVFILLKVLLMIFSRILNFVSMIFIEGMCLVALVPMVITISGSKFHLLLLMLFIIDWFFFNFCSYSF